MRFFPNVELSEFKVRSNRSGCIRVDSYTVIKKIIQECGLDEMIPRIIGKDSRLFLDLAAY